MPEYFRDHLRKQDERVGARPVRTYTWDSFIGQVRQGPVLPTAIATGVILERMARRNQCQECGWYSLESRPVRDIRHFGQCSQHNPDGVME